MKEFWKNVERRIIQLGVTEHNLTESTILLEDIDNDTHISIILVCASTYTAKIKDEIPNIFSFNHLLKQYYTRAKCLATIS